MLLAGTMGCSVPAATPPVLEDPTPLARCSVKRSAQSPLVTEWPASEKAHLESLLQTGAVAVAYNGCELRLLETCHPAGDYTFHRTSLASDTIEITSVDDLYAKLPLGAAALEAKLASSGRLAIDTTAVGQLRLDGAAELPDTPDCREATHVVRALSVGAFDMRAGGETAASGGVDVGPAAVGGARRRTSRRLRAAGDPEVCPRTGDEPHPGCRAPLQLFLTPAVLAAPTLAATKAPEPAEPVEPVEPVDPPPPVAPAPVTLPPPAPTTPADPCAHVKVEVVRVRPQPPRPLHLPRGGSRVSLLFVNEGDVDLEFPGAYRLVVRSQAGDAHSPITLPGLELWRMPMELPAHMRRQVEVVLSPGLRLADIAEVRVTDVGRADDPFAKCTLRVAREP